MFAVRNLPVQERAGHQQHRAERQRAWSRQGQTIVCENAGADWLPFTTLTDRRRGIHYGTADEKTAAKSSGRRTLSRWGCGRTPNRSRRFNPASLTNEPKLHGDGRGVDDLNLPNESVGTSRESGRKGYGHAAAASRYRREGCKSIAACLPTHAVEAADAIWDFAHCNVYVWYRRARLVGDANDHRAGILWHATTCFWVKDVATIDTTQDAEYQDEACDIFHHQRHRGCWL